MLTTEGQPALVQRARACGAKGWVIKPFKPDLLLMAVARYAAGS
jgi:two-component system chemotaxis response regulator CheY